MTSNKPTIRFDHQVFDFSLFFDLVKDWRDAVSTPLGGFSSSFATAR